MFARSADGAVAAAAPQRCDDAGAPDALDNLIDLE